ARADCYTGRRVRRSSDDAGERQPAVLRRAAAGAGRRRDRALQRPLGPSLAAEVATAPPHLGEALAGRAPVEQKPRAHVVDQLHRHAAVGTRHRLLLCRVRLWAERTATPRDGRPARVGTGVEAWGATLKRRGSHVPLSPWE